MKKARSVKKWRLKKISRGDFTRHHISCILTSVCVAEIDHVGVGQTRNHLHQGPGGGVLPYKGLMGTCGQPGYVFRDFCLKQGIEFIIFCLNQGIDLCKGPQTNMLPVNAGSVKDLISQK